MKKSCTANTASKIRNVAMAWVNGGGGKKINNRFEIMSGNICGT